MSKVSLYGVWGVSCELRSHSWLIGGWVLWPAASDAEEAAKGQEEEGRGRGGGGGGGEAKEEESRVREFPNAPAFSAADAFEPGVRGFRSLLSRPPSSSSDPPFRRQSVKKPSHGTCVSQALHNQLPPSLRLRAPARYWVPTWCAMDDTDGFLLS